MTEIGLDPERVLAIASRLDREQRAILTVLGQVRGEVGGAAGVWHGADVEHFQTDWRQRESELRAAAEAIEELADKARSNVAQQVQTSNNYGGEGGIVTTGSRGGWGMGKPDVIYGPGTDPAAGGGPGGNPGWWNPPPVPVPNGPNNGSVWNRGGGGSVWNKGGGGGVWNNGTPTFSGGEAIAVAGGGGLLSSLGNDAISVLGRGAKSNGEDGSWIAGMVGGVAGGIAGTLVEPGGGTALGAIEGASLGATVGGFAGSAVGIGASGLGALLGIG